MLEIISLLLILAIYAVGLLMPRWWVRLFHPRPKCQECGRPMIATHDHFWYCLICATARMEGLSQYVDLPPKFRNFVQCRWSDG